MAKKQQHGERPRVPEFPASLFAWPALVAASVGEAFAASLAGHPAASETAAERQPVWTTPHRLRLELPTMELREFSTRESGVSALISAPLPPPCPSLSDFDH